MDLYLLEDYQFELIFKRLSPQSVIGAADFFLRDKKLSPSGQGVVSDKRFPWAVDYLKDSKETEMFGFNLCVSFEATMGETPPMLTTVVTGNFVDLLKYVYGISKAPKCLKLTFGATLTLPKGQYCITVVHDMKTCTEKGAVEFNVASILDKKSADKIWEYYYYSPTSGTMTVKLSAENKPISGQVVGLTEKILHGKRHPDFVLISENDVKFPCHKGFLSADSSFFERMFETDCKETQSGKAKLNLSEEGLKAFLDFVYCFKLDFPKEHPRIAVELLEFAHEKQVCGLEEAMKELIVGQPHDWMDLIDGVQLFLLSVKLDFEQGYDDVKKAAVKAIKAKRDQLKDSEVCKKLLMSNAEATMELLRIGLE